MKVGEILLEVIVRRYEVRLTLMTSKRPIQKWGKLLNDVPAASAILDGLLQDADFIQVSGRSYRLHQAARHVGGGSGLPAEKKEGVLPLRPWLAR